MSEYVSKKALLEWLRKRLGETQFVREAHVFAEEFGITIPGINAPEGDGW